MRDEEQGDLLFEQELFHPQDRIEVHVIGWLVEQQKARLGGQGLSKEAATLQAA